MKIGIIGDNFAGPGDIANMLAKAGERTVQCVGTPTERPAEESIDVAVSALKRTQFSPMRRGSVTGSPGGGRHPC